jgi:hypothetical protein
MGTDNSGVEATSYDVSYVLNDAAAVPVLSGQTGASAQFSIADLADGSYTCVVTITTDKSKTASKTASFTIDTAPPPPPPTGWTVKLLTSSDTVLQTGGTLLYAYRGASSSLALEGVTFEAGADLSAASIAFVPSFAAANVQSASNTGTLRGLAWNFGSSSGMDDIKLTFHKASTETELAIPLAQSSVKAGFPSPAQDYMSEEIDLNRLLIPHPEATFFVRISGDSMMDAGILDGEEHLRVGSTLTGRHKQAHGALGDGGIGLTEELHGIVEQQHKGTGGLLQIGVKHECLGFRSYLKVEGDMLGTGNAGVLGSLGSSLLAALFGRVLAAFVLAFFAAFGFAALCSLFAALGTFFAALGFLTLAAFVHAAFCFALLVGAAFAVVLCASRIADASGMFALVVANLFGLLGALLFRFCVLFAVA